MKELRQFGEENTVIVSRYFSRADEWPIKKWEGIQICYHRVAH